MGSFNNCMTNVTNPHTCTIGSVDLVLAAVFLPRGHLLELAGDVFSGPTVNVPIGVDAVGAVRSCSNFVLVLGVVVIFIVAVPAVFGRVPKLATDMTARGIRTRPGGAAATTRFGVGGAAAAGVGGATTVDGASRPPFGAGRATTATTTARCGVGRGLEAAGGAMKLGHALIEVAQHGIELIEGDRRDAGVEGGDERLVVGAQPMEDVRDQLIVLDGFSGDGELISEAAEGGEVGGNGLVALLRVDERSSDVVDAAEGLGREHARQSQPKVMRRGDRGDRDQDLPGQRTRQIAEHLLVLPDPKWVERVGLRSLLAVFVLGDVESGRFRRGVVDVAEDTGAPQVGGDLRAPEHVIRAVELLGDLVVEARLGGAG